MILRNDLLFPDLSYQIVGCAFEVFNQIGAGHLEKIYQKAMALSLAKAGLEFSEQIPFEITFDDKKIGYGKFDFLVERKIVVEIKQGNHFSPSDFHQVKSYLSMAKLELGILIRFTPGKVLSKRVINSNSAIISTI